MTVLEAQLSGSDPAVVVTLCWVSPFAVLALSMTEDAVLENPTNPPAGMTFVLGLTRNGRVLSFGSSFNVPELPEQAEIAFTVVSATQIDGVLL